MISGMSSGSRSGGSSGSSSGSSSGNRNNHGTEDCRRFQISTQMLLSRMWPGPVKSLGLLRRTVRHHSAEQALAPGGSVVWPFHGALHTLDRTNLLECQKVLSLPLCTNTGIARPLHGAQTDPSAKGGIGAGPSQQLRFHPPRTNRDRMSPSPPQGHWLLPGPLTPHRSDVPASVNH